MRGDAEGRGVKTHQNNIKMQLILNTKDLLLEADGRSFSVSAGEVKQRISPKKVSSIAVTRNCLLSASAIKLAVEHQIPILFLNQYGKMTARLWSPYFESIATLRRNQVDFADSPEATLWIIDTFRLKTQNQIANLKYLGNRCRTQKQNLQTAIDKMERLSTSFDQHAAEPLHLCKSQLMGVEGNIAKTYWKSLKLCLPKEYGFEKRTRRPAKDIFNAALNYFYGMTYALVEGALFAAGLDPHLGFLHADEYDQPTLAFDAIEPFRPWVDRLLIEKAMANELYKSHFDQNKEGCYLNKEGKKVLIPLYNDWAEDRRRWQGKQLSNKNHIYQFAGLLAQQLRNFDEDEK